MVNIHKLQVKILTNLSYVMSSQWVSYTIMLGILAMLEQMLVIQEFVPESI